MQHLRMEGKFRAMTDDGVQEFPIYVAVAHNGEHAEFKTLAAAQWWLKLDNNHKEWQERRAGLVEAGLV